MPQTLNLQRDNSIPPKSQQSRAQVPYTGHRLFDTSSPGLSSCPESLLLFSHSCFLVSHPHKLSTPRSLSPTLLGGPQAKNPSWWEVHLSLIHMKAYMSSGWYQKPAADVFGPVSDDGATQPRS